MNAYQLYKILPYQIQNLLCSVHGYNLKRQRYGKYFFETLDFLLTTDSWTKTQIQTYKEEHIYQMLENAYLHCPYYKKKYKDLGLSPSNFTCLNDLNLFPILQKEEVRKNWKGMISDKYEEKKLIYYHTSGSTGKALDFYWTQQSLQFYWAIVWRARRRFGISMEDEHLNFTGKLVVPLQEKGFSFWRYNYPMHQCLLNMQHLSKDKMRYIVDMINNSSFQYYIGYPSIISSFASLLDESEYKLLFTPKCIFTGAEKLYFSQKKIIQKAMPTVQICEHYGFSENAAAADKCKNEVYHEDFEMGHLELKNPSVAKKGFKGQMLATGFINEGMPFIRYEIGDTALFSDELCSCGLQSQVILDIEGRNEEYVITPEGTHIMRFDYIFKDAHYVKECQVIQRKLGSIILKIVKRDGYTSIHEQSLIREINNCISPTLKVYFEYVDEIPRTKAGKFKAVISELKKEE